MRIVMIAFVSFMILCAVSAVRADETSIDRAGDAMRNHGPVVQQPPTTKAAILGGSVATASWTDRASLTFGGGF